MPLSRCFVKLWKPFPDLRPLAWDCRGLLNLCRITFITTVLIKSQEKTVSNGNTKLALDPATCTFFINYIKEFHKKMSVYIRRFHTEYIFFWFIIFMSNTFCNRSWRLNECSGSKKTTNYCALRSTQVQRKGVTE